MKKKLLMFSIISFFLVLPTMTTKAINLPNVGARRECDRFELANAYREGNDGKLSKVSCYDSYDAAKNAMYSDTREDLVIIENGTIIDAKYGVVDYDIDFPENHGTKFIRVYSGSGNGDQIGYIKGGTPDEGVLVNYDYNTKRARMKVGGLTGWINKVDEYGLKLYDIIPIAWTETPSYYKVTNDMIAHVFPGNVFGTKGSYTWGLDIKPTMLAPGNYYSYDGIYFYNNIKVMINDYKNNRYSNAVNANNPYYSYYQYLPFRTKTIYNADNLNQYINAHTGGDSKLRGTGAAFINAQNNYGTNAALLLSIGINESGWGTSWISHNKNNLFGLNAVDATPGQSANYFPSVADCIKTYAYKWISFGYAQPGDWRFEGDNLGNKGEGFNMNYASDPFWGEKGAHYYYELDKMFDFQERKQNQQSIAVLNGNYDAVYAKRSPNGDNISGYYKYRRAGSPVVIKEETKDANGKTWYKIQSDPTLYADGGFVVNSGDSGGDNHYFWNSYAYVSSDNFRKVSNSSTPTPVVEPETDTNLGTAKTTEVIKNAGYNYQGGVVTGIGINTDTNGITNNLKAKGITEVVVKNSNGQVKTGKLVTGDTITITVDGKSSTITVVIYGDVTGDGAIDKTDCSEILKQFYGYVNYTGAKRKALDVNKDGNVDKLDASEVLKHHYGYSQIKQ